ncbi:transglutaminase domain-containing protein [Bacteroides sp. UBA939]|uniref:transglutaminase domain-containing protein n=1 Tax=Bacteroides sp. UBA939 TaxID=1946092 RepID=UPI0025BCAB50|nr:transglutaminase domain-containing protein [Bacteroides sp. UBA939]
MFPNSRHTFFAWSLALCLLLPFGKLLSVRNNIYNAETFFPISTVAYVSSDSLLPEYLTFPDSVAMAAPAAVEQSPRALVTYMKQYLHTQDQLIRAIYTWVSRNIKYNVYITFSSRNEDLDEAKEIQKILSERKGVCQHYALLFKVLAEEAGMDAYIINGYNRVNDVVLPDPHQWCAVRVEDKWYMFDPTWGAGFIDNHQFVPLLNHRYCKLSPDSLLKTHMPFDPLFQFRERPLTYEEFDGGTFDEQRSVPIFYWPDTLSLYAKQDTPERLSGARLRILANGQANALVYYTLELTTNNIRISEYQKILNAYNEAMELQGKATDAINQFIRYRNQAFEPLKSDEEIQAMVDVPERLINRADSVINIIHSAPDKYRQPILELRDQIMDVATTVYKHKLFLRQYFKLPAKQRKGLFKQTK